MKEGVVNIHGKEYKTVALRVSEFREVCPDWSIVTELVSADEERVVMKAVISHLGVPIGTGYAEEVRSASRINQTSALENAETSAIGRALAACGWGSSGTEYASADEVANAIQQQNTSEAVAPLMAHNQAVRENFASIVYMKEAHENGDALAFAEAWLELDDDTKSALWLAPTKGGVFTTAERAYLRSDEVNQARKEIING